MAVSQIKPASDREAQLLRLLELQEVDVEIMALEDQREEIPRQQQRHEEAVYAAQRSFEENEHQIALIDEELTSKTQLLDLDRIRKKNARSKDATIENIAQYDALAKGQEDGEFSGEELEAAFKALQRRLDELQTARKRLLAEIDDLTKTRDEQHRMLNARLTELDQLLDALYDRRDEMAETVSESLLLKYERIAERKEGIAIARVEHGHCLACNMAIPPQLYNQLMKQTQLIACPACSRILVYTEPAAP